MLVLKYLQLNPTHAASPPGSSRRAGGYSPVLRLTADDVSLPYSPVPKSSPSGTRLYCRGGHFGSRSAPRVRSRTPQGRFPPARLLHPGGRCGHVGYGSLLGYWLHKMGVDPPAGVFLRAPGKPGRPRSAKTEAIFWTWIDLGKPSLSRRRLAHAVYRAEFTKADSYRRTQSLLVAAGEQEDLRPFFAPRERGRALGFSAIPMCQNGQNGHVLGHEYEFALNFSSGSADLLVVVRISHKVAKPDGTFRWLVPCPELGHW